MTGLAFLGLWLCASTVTFAVWYAIDTRLDNAAAARRARNELAARRRLAELQDADRYPHDRRRGVQ